ncbi:site-specific DNA-methyltransferase [Peribacillus simplex]|uniref:site-specific DNA-methyltransferase n=1 Tax=Peribacillus simplex TaxID=1478 RepID=UPI0021A9F143|nr:site-specific DNA-methyltransferase [Peribacillus simplex]
MVILRGLCITQPDIPVNALKIIATHTNEGETVLDCFMASGSTGQATINLNRNFIGFELDKTYFNEASNALHRGTAS